MSQVGLRIFGLAEAHETISNGSVESLRMRRSRKNVPISVQCPGGAVKSGMIVTEFDYLVGGALNFLNMPIGWIVDPFSDKAFFYHPVDLSRYCDNEKNRVKSGQLNKIGIE